VVKFVALLLACIALQEVSRDVLQAHPKLERVKTINWCEGTLVERSWLEFEGKTVGPVDSVQVWPSPSLKDEKPRPWGLKFCYRTGWAMVCPQDLHG